MKTMLSKSSSLILATLFSFSLIGCASYSGGGDASGWANAEREVLIEGAVMLPLAIISLPVTLPYTLVKEGLKTDSNKDKNYDSMHKKDLTRYVEVNFLSLNQDEYSMPTLYYNQINQQYRAWIPVYESDFKDTNKSEHLKSAYTAIFQNMVTTIPSKDNWIAYQYQTDKWLVLDQGCKTQGLYSKDIFNTQVERTEEVFHIENLCRKHD